jgi:hypothetical protein
MLKVLVYKVTTELIGVFRVHHFTCNRVSRLIRLTAMILRMYKT